MYLGIRRPKKVIKIPAILKGKIAIVIDDWGYNLDNLYLLGQIKYPFTASVLPGLGYSKAVAAELHKRGFQIILHLPMEPHEKYRLEKNTILASMDEQAIINIGAKKFGLKKIVEISSRIVKLLDTDPEYFILDKNGIKKAGCDPQLWTIAAKMYFSK